MQVVLGPALKILCVLVGPKWVQNQPAFMFTLIKSANYIVEALGVEPGSRVFGKWAVPFGISTLLLWFQLVRLNNKAHSQASRGTKKHLGDGSVGPKWVHDIRFQYPAPKFPLKFPENMTMSLAC